MFQSKNSKTSSESIEHEAALLKSALTQLQEDVKSVMSYSDHPDETTRQLSDSAVEQLRALQKKLEKTIKGKETVLRKRKSTKLFTRFTVKMITGASVRSGVSPEVAEAKEKDIMERFQLDSKEAMEKYESNLNVPENPAHHRGNYFSENVQEPSSIPATHPQLPGLSSHRPVKYPKTKSAVNSSQYNDRTPAATAGKYIFESEEPIHKGKSSEESIRFGQRIISPRIFGKGDPEVIGAFVKARYQTTPTRASSALTSQTQPPGASTSQAHGRMKTHHTSSGKGKQTHEESFGRHFARDMALHHEENVPSPSLRNYSHSSASNSLRAPSRDLQGSVDSLEYQEWEYGPQYDSAYDSSSEFDPREIEESMERVSIASRDTFGQPKHGKHKYGGAGNTQGGKPSNPY